MNAAELKRAKEISAYLKSLGGAKAAAVPKKPLSLSQQVAAISQHRGKDVIKEKKIFFGRPGRDGLRGDKGDSIQGKRGIPGRDGRDGKDGLNGRDGKDGKDGVNLAADTAEQIAEKLNELEGALESKVIKDLPVFDIKDLKHGGKYQLELRDIKGARLDRASGRFDMNDQRWHGGGSTSGGSTGYQQVTSGAIDGSNLVFSFTTAPNVISVDNVPRQKVSSDGTVNWTGTTTVTLAVAPNYDIYALA